MLAACGNTFIKRVFVAALIVICILPLAACDDSHDYHDSHDSHDWFDDDFDDVLYDMFDSDYDETDSSTTTGDGNDYISAADPIEFDVTYNESISSTTDVDYYSIAIPATSETIITLSKLTDDLDFYLFDSNGHLLVSSQNGGSGDETINYFSSWSFSTTIYIKVNGYSSAISDYSLTATNNICISADGNDTIETAETIDLDITFNKSISTTCDVDFYSITVPGDTTTTISLANLTSDIDLYLLDSNGYIILSSENVGTDDETIVYTSSPSPETLYVKVSGYEYETGDYSITVVNDVDTYTSIDGNDTIETAEAIDFDIVYAKSIENYSDIDYYSIVVPPETAISVLISDFDGELDLSVYDGTYSIASTSSGSGYEYTSYAPGATTPTVLYIRVSRLSGVASTYNLKAISVDSSEIDNNDSPANASPIEFNTLYNKSISNYYDNDFYSISVLEGATYTFTLTGLTVGLDLYLFRNDLNPIAYSYGNLSDDVIVNYTATSSSKIYLQVSGGCVYENYTLSVVPTTP